MNQSVFTEPKILYIITQADGGGAQKYTLSLAKYFKGAIAAGNEAGKLFIDAQRAGLATFELKHLKRNINPMQEILAAWEIRELIKHYQPDIVHLNSTKAGVLGSFAAIGLKKKVVFTAHGFIFNEPFGFAAKSFAIAAEKIASEYRNFIITVSEADRKSALDNKLIAANKIQTIHNGIPNIKFLSKPEALTALGLPENKLIVGSVANFYKTKGLDVLITAFSELNPEIKEKTLLVIVGEGRERKLLEKLISDLKLENSVKLLGSKTEVPEAITAFDIFALASRKEGLPYTILEAMQAGLPIVATNVGGISEALGNTGEIVEPENPKAFAKALTDLIKNEQKRKDLSLKTKERSKLFTEEKMFEETNNVYKKLLAS